VSSSGADHARANETLASVGMLFFASTRRIMWAWVFTIPGTALVAAGTYPWYGWGHDESDR